MPEDDGPGTRQQPQGGMPSRGAGSRLDRWVDAYAQRTRGMTASEIRALFAVASRPEVVSLAGGMPFLSALPAGRGRRGPRPGSSPSAGRVALQYGSGQGDPELREQDHRRDGAAAGRTRTRTTSSSRPARSRRSTS